MAAAVISDSFTLSPVSPYRDSVDVSSGRRHWLCLRLFSAQFMPLPAVVGNIFSVLLPQPFRSQWLVAPPFHALQLFLFHVHLLSLPVCMQVPPPPPPCFLHTLALFSCI